MPTEAEIIRGQIYELARELRLNGDKRGARRVVVALLATEDTVPRMEDDSAITKYPA
jgi:hypothetical protein